MTVVRLAEFRSRELVAVCRELLQLAEQGELHGLVFAMKIGRRTHKTGIAGDYARSPSEALEASHKMLARLVLDNDGDREFGTF